MVMFVELIAVISRRRHVLVHGHWLRVHRCSDLLDNCVEAIVIVGGVLDDPHRAVRLIDAVRAVHYVTVAYLVLGLHVARVGVVHPVVEGVLWMSLQFANRVYYYEEAIFIYVRTIFRLKINVCV